MPGALEAQLSCPRKEGKDTSLPWVPEMSPLCYAALPLFGQLLRLSWHPRVRPTCRLAPTPGLPVAWCGDLFVAPTGFQTPGFLEFHHLLPGCNVLLWFISADASVHPCCVGVSTPVHGAA